jgi:hypothetical protein
VRCQRQARVGFSDFVTFCVVRKIVVNDAFSSSFWNPEMSDRLLAVLSMRAGSRDVQPGCAELGGELLLRHLGFLRRVDALTKERAS